jgi:hypothetical protein
MFSNRPYRIVRHDIQTGRIWSVSPYYWQGMSKDDLARNAAITARDRLERRIQATLESKTQPMVRFLHPTFASAYLTSIAILAR